MASKVETSPERKKLLLQSRDALLRVLSEFATEQAITTTAAFAAMQRAVIEQFEQRSGQDDARASGRAQSMTLSQLSLVDDADLDVDLALEALSREIREQSEGVLGLLHGCYRQVLGDALGETVPVGPETVCAALEAFAESSEVDRDTGLALIDKAHATLVAKLDRFYKELCRQFEHAGIRPETQGPRAKPTRLPRQPGATDGTPNGGLAASTGTQSGTASRTGQLTLLQQVGFALGRKQHSAAAPPAAASGGLAGFALPIPPDLLERLLPGASGRESGFPSLLMSPEAGIALRVLEQLFDTLANDSTIPAALRARIEQLRLPCQRLALHDASLLETTTHPALAGLDALADIGRTLPGTTREHPLLEIVDAQLQALVGADQPETASFAALTATLTELAITRREQADALAQSKHAVASGAIKWEAARVLAARALSILIEPGTPAAVRRFLDDYWLRVLTRTAYQHGQKHPDWRTQLELAHELVQTSASGDANAFKALDHALETHLAASGLDMRQCRQALDAFEAPHTASGASLEPARAVLTGVRNHPEVRMLHHESGGVSLKAGPELEACFTHDHWIEIDTDALRMNGHVRTLTNTRRMLMIVDPDQPLVLLASMSALAELLENGQLTLYPAGSACARATEAILAVLDSDGV